MFLLPRGKHSRGGKRRFPCKNPAGDKPDCDPLALAADLLAREVVNCFLVCLLTVAVLVAA